MGYNKENFGRVRAEFELKYIAAREEADKRREELHTKIPGLRELDRSLGGTCAAILRAASYGREGLEGRIEILRAENKSLLESRARLLERYGYPPDYTEVKYECAKCADSGYDDGHMCECMRSAIIYAGYESSGIGSLLREQTFENFSLDYYKNDKTAHNSSANTNYEKMKYVLGALRRFADEFGTGGEWRNIILFGGTGLGKTHLSSAVAGCVIRRGYDVLYVTAHDMFSDFETDRFRGGAELGAGEIARYFECDLLILDDLGSELSNQFTVSCLYNVINKRHIKGKSTIISTNLTQSELRGRYWDRITSRIFGEYRPLIFVGTDVRAQKLCRS